MHGRVPKMSRKLVFGMLDGGTTSGRRRSMFVVVSEYQAVRTQRVLFEKTSDLVVDRIRNSWDPGWLFGDWSGVNHIGFFDSRSLQRSSVRAFVTGT